MKFHEMTEMMMDHSLLISHPDKQQLRKCRTVCLKGRALRMLFRSPRLQLYSGSPLFVRPGFPKHFPKIIVPVTRDPRMAKICYFIIVLKCSLISVNFLAPLPPLLSRNPLGGVTLGTTVLNNKTKASCDPDPPLSPEPSGPVAVFPSLLLLISDHVRT